MGLDEDGLPVDPAPRALAIHVLSIVGSGVSGRREVSATILYRNRGRRSVDVDDLRAAIDALVRGGRLIASGPDGIRAGNGAAFERALAAGRKTLHAAAHARAVELFDPRLVPSAERFFLAFRLLNRIHAAPVAGGGIVLAADGFVVEGEDLVATGAAALVSRGGSTTIRRIGPPALRMRVRAADEPILSLEVDPGADGFGPALPDDLDGLPLFVASLSTGREVSLPSEMRDAVVACSKVERSAFEAFAGRAVDPEAWRAFSRSLRAVQVEKKRMIFQRLAARSLDPEARRAAMRDFQGDVALYRWYCGPDARTGLWRRQAAAAWPILSMMMPALAPTIDAGAPLTDAVATVLDIPRERVVEMRGLTWQRAGSAFQRDITSRKPELVGLMRRLPSKVTLAEVAALAGRDEGPPGPLPRSRRRRKGWADGFDLLSRRLVELLGTTGRVEAFDRLMERDFAAVADRLADASAVDCIRGPAGLLAHLVPGDPTVVRGSLVPVVLAATIGPEGSLKRWRRQDERFHRGTRAVTAALAAMVERADRRSRRPSRWSPTAGPWTSPHGTMRWLTSPEDLAQEGARMDHCVGGYYLDVACGGSVVASVTASDGTRSTVELAAGRRSLAVVQHAGVSNSAPSDACAATVAAFVAALAAGDVEPDYGRLAKARSRNAAILRDTPLTRLARRDPGAFLDAVRPILPPSIAGLDAADVRAALEAAASAPGREDGEFWEPPSRDWLWPFRASVDGRVPDRETFELPAFDWAA